MHYGELLCLVFGVWGECSEDLHSLVQTCAESKVELLLSLYWQARDGGVVKRHHQPEHDQPLFHIMFYNIHK